MAELNFNRTSNPSGHERLNQINDQIRQIKHWFKSADCEELYKNEDFMNNELERLNNLKKEIINNPDHAFLPKVY